MLEVKDATMMSGKNLLFSRLSFCVNQGEVLGIYGTSGSGKSSLLRAILGFMPLDSGFINIDGELITPESSVFFRQMMSYLPQDISFPDVKVDEIIRNQVFVDSRRKTISNSDEMASMSERLHIDVTSFTKQISEISISELRRMLLADIILTKKPIILIDELEYAQEELMLNELMSLTRETAQKGSAVILVSSSETIIGQCDKKVILNTGL